MKYILIICDYIFARPIDARARVDRGVKKG